MNVEPLKNKIIEMEYTLKEDNSVHKINIFYEDDVKLAVKFYKKYYNNIDLFIKDYPDVARQHFEDMDSHDRLYNVHTYNKWLFEYCFQDVIK